MMTKTLTLTFALTLMAVATAGAAHAAKIFVHNASGDTIKVKYQTKVLKKEWKTVSIDSNSRKSIDTGRMSFEHFHIDGKEQSVKRLGAGCTHAHLIIGSPTRFRLGHKGVCE